MAEIKCVEPALLDEHPGAHYVCLAKREDTLIFPHVDVCLATAWITTRTGQMIGGHVPGQWDQTSPVDPNGCAQRIFSLMDKKWSERSVDLIVTLGDASEPGSPGWTNIVKTMVRNLGATRYLMLWKNIPGGADLRIDGPGQKLSIVATRTGQLVLERPLDGIGAEELPVRYSTPARFKVAENLKTHFKAEPFKGAGMFHDSCPAKEQERITSFFKDIFTNHGPCTAFESPLDSNLSGPATFRFGSGEKVIVTLTLAQHARFADRYLITNVTSPYRRFGQPA